MDHWRESPDYVNYTPLTEREQDVVDRMIDDQQMYVEVEWLQFTGYHPNPEFQAGDKRLKIEFPLEFQRPENFELPVRNVTLRLKRRDGTALVETVEPTIHNGQPLMVSEGKVAHLVWDLMLDEIDGEIASDILGRIQAETVAEIEGGEVVYHDEDLGTSSSEGGSDEDAETEEGSS